MPPTCSSTRNTNTSYSPTARSATTIRRASPGPSSGPAKPSIRLTVKSAPSKLRQAVGTDDLPPNPYTADDTPEPPVRTSRSTRNQRTIVEADSDEEADEQEEDEDEDEEEEDDEEDAEGDIDAELLANEDSEEDAEGEEDADEDMDMDEPHPPPPVIKANPKTPTNKGKQKETIKTAAPPAGTLKSVEAKEEEDDDEELSELDSDENLDEDEEEEEGSGLDDDEDGSRDGTPDLSKLTRRQRAAYEEGLTGSLMALSNEAQKKKHLTAEEHAMRRLEMARRRKNLSEKRNEEEKLDTINKLLKKPAPKRRTRAEIMAAAAAAGEYDGEESADPLYVRWVNDAAGSRIGVPTEWLQAPVGAALEKGWKGPPEPKLIEEVA
ncbi:hypothetical protein MBLNU457_g0496t2 [Dothideomycetes sp. NU457]